jgi:hypothetical protein
MPAWPARMTWRVPNASITTTRPAAGLPEGRPLPTMKTPRRSLVVAF